MKPQLLEYLVRQCVREVLKQTSDLPADEEPEDSATDDNTPPEPPEDQGNDLLNPDDAEGIPSAIGKRGLYLINPRDRTKLQRLNIRSPEGPSLTIPDAELDRKLYRTLATVYGKDVKMDPVTLRTVKGAIRNPNLTYYLYVVKHEGHPTLMASKSLQTARSSAMPFGGATSSMGLTPSRIFQPTTAISQQHASNMGQDTELQEAEDEKNKESEPTKGAPAPPEAGQGTADQPEIPKKDAASPETPAGGPEKSSTPSPTKLTQPSPALKGVLFVNPKDKAKIQKVQVQGMDNASIERSLHQQAARIAGPRVKVSVTAADMVKGALQNPSTSVYLYLGKYDPNSEEIFLMADKSLQVAKDASIPPGAMTGTPVSSVAPQNFNPLTAGGQSFTQPPQAGLPRIDERLVKAIRLKIKEVLEKR